MHGSIIKILNFPAQKNYLWYAIYLQNKIIFSTDNSQTNEQYKERIHLVDDKTGLGKASINLTLVREEDIGWYECKIFYPNRSPQNGPRSTSWFHLSLDGLSLLKIPPVNQTVLEYEPAFFQCAVKDPDTTFVTWYKDGELLSTFQDLATRTVLGQDGSLLITPTIMTGNILIQ